jgi:hypothetical protein
MYGSSGKAHALQEWSPEFKVQSHQIYMYLYMNICDYIYEWKHSLYLATLQARLNLNTYCFLPKSLLWSTTEENYKTIQMNTTKNTLSNPNWALKAHTSFHSFKISFDSNSDPYIPPCFLLHWEIRHYHHEYLSISHWGIFKFTPFLHSRL